MFRSFLYYFFFTQYYFKDFLKYLMLRLYDKIPLKSTKYSNSCLNNIKHLVCCLKTFKTQSKFKHYSLIYGYDFLFFTFQTFTGGKKMLPRSHITFLCEIHFIIHVFKKMGIIIQHTTRQWKRAYQARKRNKVYSRVSPADVSRGMRVLQI